MSMSEDRAEWFAVRNAVAEASFGAIWTDLEAQNVKIGELMKPY
jgi:hypothetical protein